MITFLPYTSFDRTAECLDYRRLGKQRVEALQILHQLDQANTLVVKMWRNYPYTLARYGRAMCLAWKERGYKDNLQREFESYMLEYQCNPTMPVWLERGTNENRLLIRSHRSNLLRKDPDYYREFWPKLPDDYAYYWPVPRRLVII